MSDVVAMKPTTEKKASLSQIMASRFDLEPQIFMETIKKTCFPNGQATNEQLIAFLAVANEHGLNPFTREIYAFPGKGGGIQPIVGIDGWMKLINNHPQFDGMEFQDEISGEGKLYAVTCRIYRKDRKYPMPVTERMDECYRPTEPWKQMPHRMLRHKAIMQCARYAFGFAGIQDEDEARDVIQAEVGPAIATATATESKKEELKTKIGAKKAKAQQEEPKPVDPPVVPEPEPPAPVPETPKPELDPVAKGIQALVTAGRIKEAQDPNLKILGHDRQILLDEIKRIADPLSQENKAKFEEEAKAVLMSLGCSKSWDLRYDLLVDFYGWLDRQSQEALV
jgi:phage recombination protein Bet